MKKLATFSLILILLVMNANVPFLGNNVIISICNMFQLLFLIFVLVCSSSYNLFLHNNIIFNRDFKLLSLFILLILFAIIRSAELDTVTLFSIVFDIFILVLLYLYAIKVILLDKSSIQYIFYGIFAFLLANILLFAIGIHNPLSDKTISDEASLLHFIGIEMDRRLYPLYPGAGWVGIGTLAGLLFSYNLAYLPISKNKYLLLLSSLVPLWIMISSDSRGALLASLLTVSLFYLTHKFKIKSIRYLPFAIPLFPFLLLYISYLAFEYGIAADIARSGQDISTGRSIIWAIASNELLDFKSVHLIGYGLYGHAISGISYDYMNLFSSWSSENPELFSLHNIAFQLVFDIGYIGLLLYIYLTYRLFCIALDSKDYRINMLAAVLIYIEFAGITDTVPLLYGRSGFIVFLLVSSYLFQCNSASLLLDKNCKIHES
jgi:hypothetical protein